MQVPFHRHALGTEHTDLIGDIIRNGFLTSGKTGKAVEVQIREFFGTRHALLVNSWTNGAVAVLLAADIGPGDEVIVPAMTFIATANVVELVGATPVFVDVDPDTLMIDPAALVNALTPKTRAVMVVHLYGQMYDMAALRNILRERPDIKIFEDAAHCFEGTLNGKRPGTYSDAAIFSFYATKNLTCGEGGAIITNDDALADKIVQTRLHGMSASAIDRYQGGQYHHWDMLRLGTKANLPDMLSAVLPPQISGIEAARQIRHTLATNYRKAFSGKLRMPEWRAGIEHAHCLFPIHVDPAFRDTAMGLLNNHGIGATINFRSVPGMAFYRDKYGFTPDMFPVSHLWGEGTISLPLFPTMTIEEQDYVIEVVLKHLVPN
jgi:UDP-4-amino-4-deoxy-L-arabinose-oxoglutarate aminotransferase